MLLAFVCEFAVLVFHSVISVLSLLLYPFQRAIFGSLQTLGLMKSAPDAAPRRRELASQNALEFLETRVLLTTIDYTVDIENPDYLLNPGGLADGDVDLAVRIGVKNGNAVLQLIDVDRGNVVVGDAPFSEDIEINITGYQTQSQGQTLEFQESLSIDLTNNTGLPAAPVSIDIDFDGIKGVLPLVSDSVIITQATAGPVYSPSGLDITLTNGDSITVSGAIPASGDVSLTVDGAVTVTGSITTPGDISLNASKTTTLTDGEADGLDPLNLSSVAVAINGGTLSGKNVTLSALSVENVTISSAAVLSGQINFAEVFASSEATVTVDGNSGVTATGVLSLGAVSSVTTVVTRGTQVDDDPDNDTDQDAAIAASVILSNAAVTVADSASLTAGDDLILLAQNMVNTTTTADGQQGDADGGGVVAVSTVEGHTSVNVQDNVILTAADQLTISATSNRTVTTTAIATPGGATDDGDSDTTTTGQATLANPDGDAATDDKASTADGDLTLAAAIAVHTLTGSTQANLSGGTLTSTSGNISITSTMINNVTTTADGSTTTGEGDTGVGIGVGIGAADLSNKATISGTVSLDAGSVTLSAVTTPSTIVVEAKSGASGEGDGADTGVAGALAVNVSVLRTEAVVAAGSSVSLNGSNLNVLSQSVTTSSAHSVPLQTAVGQSLGVGASVSVNINDDTTRSVIQNSATLTGVNALVLAAASDHSVDTVAKAGAAGGTAIAASVAIAVANHDTMAIIENGGSPLTTTGGTSVSASHHGDVLTVSEGDATPLPEPEDQENGGQGGQGSQSEDTTAIGAAVAVNFVVDRTLAEVNRSLTAGGAVLVSSSQSADSATTAKASAKGDDDDGDQNNDGKDDDSANTQAENQRGAADSAAGSRGARGTNDAGTTPDASTSEGDIAVAAAISVNMTSTTSRAAVGPGVSLTSFKSLSISSAANSDAAAAADSSATGGGTAAIGAAVAINLASVSNVAAIGAGASIAADGVTVTASMRNDAGDVTHSLGAHSTSGAGSSSVGVAGSFAMSIGNVHTEADVRNAASVNVVDGNDAGSSVGPVKIEAISTTSSTVTADAATSISGDDADLGIGASVAINITNHDTRAELENATTVTGAHHLTLNAASDHDVITTAKGGADGAASFGFTPVVALGFAYHTTEALIGAQNGSLNISGALNILADHSGTIAADATGSVQGTDAAVGASLGLSYVKENVVATTNRSLSSSGAMTISATSDSTHSTDATASAAGAAGDPADENGNGGNGETVQGEIDTQRGYGNTQSSANTTGGKSSGTSNKATATTADSKNDSDSSEDAVTVAAAVAVSIVESNAVASIPDGLTISAGGRLTVRSTQNADASTMASGAAAGGGTGIGAAVSINVVDVGNHASIGNSSITADGLTVDAVMTNVNGNEVHDFSAESLSGAGGEDVGVAGSLSINHAAVKTSATIASGASLSLTDGGDIGTTIGTVFVRAESRTTNTAKATPQVLPGEAQTPDYGVGASVALDLTYHDTDASIADGVSWSGGPATGLTVDATADHTMTTLAANGAKAGDVGVGGAVAVVLSKSHTAAYVGTGTGTITTTGGVNVKASHTGKASTEVRSEATGGDAAIGASVGINLIEDTSSAELARDVSAGGAVTVSSQAEVSGILNVQASAGGGDGDEDGDNGPDGEGDSADAEAAKQANQSNATSDGGNDLPSANDSSSSAKDQSEDESGSNGDGSGGGSSVGVAAAVAVNVLSVHNTARISHGADVTAGGTVTVRAAAHVIALGEADSTAVDLGGDVSVGAAVALNVSSLTNTAIVETGSILNANGISILAVTTDNQTNDFRATAFAVAGNTGDAGVAGVVAINLVDADTTALVEDGTQLLSTSAINVTAEHELRAQAGAVAGAFSSDAAVAAAVAINVLGLNETRPDGSKETGGSQTVARIGDPEISGSAPNVHAGGAVSVTATHSVGMFPVFNVPNTLNDPPGNDYDKYSINDFDAELATVAMSGGGSSGSLGFAGSVAINLDESTTHATIDRGVSLEGASLNLSAKDTTKMHSAAGALGIGLDGAGIGAGLDLGIIHKDTQATIGRDATINTTGNVAVSAESSETIVSVAANIGIGNSAGIAGSASIQVVESSTNAALEDGTGTGSGVTMVAGGSTSLTASGILTATMVGGSVGGGGTAGVGASNATLIHNDEVTARVGDFADLKTGGTGLQVSATSAENLITIAAAGGAGGTGGGAGAVVVNTLNEMTTASIGRGVSIQADNAAVSGQPDVTVHASDTTTIVSVAGSLAAAGSGAAGLGADVAKLDKDTTAFIDSGATVWAEGDIFVTADSKEDFTSVAAGISGAGSAAFAMDASVHVLELTTRAYVGDDPADAVTTAGPGDVHANGSLVIAADDQTESDKMVGVLAIGGSVGFGAGAAVSATSKTTEAFIGNGAKVTADGKTSGVNARTGRYVESFVTPVQTSTTGIQSTRKTVVDDDGNEQVEQETDISASVSVGSLSAKGEVGIPTTVSTDSDRDGTNNADDPKLSKDRMVVPEVRSGFRGIAVTATNRDDLETYTISAAGSGGVSVSVSAGVNVIDNDTRAWVGENAVLNQNPATGHDQQSVQVAAGTDFAHVSFAGSLAVGSTVGIAPAASVTVLSNTTEAFIGWNGSAQNPQNTSATVNARNDVIVEAHQNEDVLLVGVGFGGATVGIGAGVDVLSIDNDTHAAIGPDSIVSAGGDVGVLASDDTDFDVISGGGGAGIAGIGGAVGVSMVRKDTDAWIDEGAVVDALAKGTGISGVFNGSLTDADTNDGDDADGFASQTIRGVVVQAHSTEQIFHFSGAVGAGFVGVAGGVTITLVDSNTSAQIRDGAQINQSDPANANSLQNVFVNAANEARIISFAGAVAGGAGAVAGGVDYGTLNNDTLAGIGSNAVVSARNDVEVNSLGIKDLDGLAFSAGGGLVGLSGTVSVWSIGTKLQKSYTDSDNKSVDAGQGEKEGTADENAIKQTQSGKGQLVGGLNSYDKSANAHPQSNESQLNAITGSAASKLNLLAPTQDSLSTAMNTGAATAGTSAFIGTKAKVTAGQDISVVASEDVEVDIIVGGFAGGLASAGASVSILNVAANTSALSAGTLSAGATVEVKSLLDERVNVIALAGAAGFVGLGAAVVEFHDHSVVQSAIGHVNSATTVTVLADADQDLNVETGQVSTGGAAFGASFTTLSADGEVTASVLPGSDIGQQPGKSVSSLNVRADSTLVAHATTTAIAAGGVPVSANFAFVDVTPDVTATVGGVSDIDVTGAASVRAVAEHEAFADVITFTGGAGGTGASITEATLDGHVDASVGGVSTIGAGSITIESRHNHNGVTATGKKARARADAASTNLAASGSGTYATAVAGTDVTTSVEDDAVLSASGPITIRSLNSANAEAVGGAVSLSLGAAFGGTIVNAHADGSTQALVAGDVAAAQSLTIRATAANTATADGLALSAAAGGGISGTAVTATASPAVLAGTEGDALVEVAGATVIEALATNTASATGDGTAIGLGAGAGFVDVSAETSGSTKAHVSGQVGKLVNLLPNSGSLSVKADSSTTAIADGTAAAGGILGGGASVKSGTVLDHTTEASIVGTVHVNGGISLLADSDTSGTATANAVALSAGVSGGDCNASVTSTPDVLATVAGGIHAGGAVTVKAVDVSTITSAGLAASGGIAAIGGGNAKNLIQSNVLASIDKGSHSSSNLTVQAQETLNTDAAAVGVALGAFGIAGGSAINDVNNDVRAEIVNDAFIKAGGSVLVSASDATTVSASVDQTSGGLVGTGTAMAINDVQNDVTAQVLNHVQLQSGGNVQVKAGETTAVSADVSGASGGIAAVSGNSVINSVQNDVAAIVSQTSSIDAENNVLIQADQNNTLSVNAANTAAGIVGVGGTVVVNTQNNSTRAMIDDYSSVSARGNGSALKIRKWDESSGVQSLEDLNGLAVIAHSRNHPDFDPTQGGGSLPQASTRAFNVSGGLAGIAGVTTVSAIDDRTEAFIATSTVNSAADPGDDVVVRAHADLLLHTFSGGVSGGFIGDTSATDRSEIQSRTRAFVSDNDESGSDLTTGAANVHGRGVDVSAISREKIRVDLLSGSGGGDAAAGTVSAAIITADTQALVRDSQVTSLGDLAVRADDTAVIDPTLKSVSVGLSAGGAAISVNTITTSVQARVIGSSLAATGATSIVADSDESVSPTVSTDSAGGGTIAGSVSINSIRTTTEALVLAGDVPSEINMLSLPGDGTSAQTVTIAANDTVTLNSKSGATSAGALGGGNSLELHNVQNRTVARIGTETGIEAGGDVTVRADSERSLISAVNGVGGGLVGLSGSTSYISLNAAVDAAAVTDFTSQIGFNPQSTLENQLNDLISTPDVSESLGAGPYAVAASTTVMSLGQPDVGDALTSDAEDRITAAIMDDAVVSSLKSSIDAGGDISLTAQNRYHLQQTTGTDSGGGFSRGAATSVASVGNTVQAFLGDGNTFAADGNVTIRAKDEAFSPDAGVQAIEQNAHGGSGGLIAGTDNEARLTLISQVTAHVGAGAEIQRAQDVTVEATESADVQAQADGFGGAALAAIGAATTIAVLEVTTTATVADTAKIGSIDSVSGVSITSAAANTVDADSHVGNGAGLGASTDGAVNVTVKPTVLAHIGEAEIDSDGNVLLTASSSNTLTSTIESVAIGGFVGDGSGKTGLTVKGSVTADVADGATIDAGLVTISAAQTSFADASGQQIGGGFAGGQAAGADAAIDMSVLAEIGDAALDVNGPVGVFANSSSTAKAKSGAFSGTGFGEGSSKAAASISGNVTAHIQSGATVETSGPGTSPFVFVGTTTTNTATATSESTAGGLINGNGTEAAADINVHNLAEIQDAAILSKGAIRVEANSTNKADAESQGTAAGILGAEGSSRADANVLGSTRAFGTGTLTSAADFIRIQALDTGSHAVATATAAGGGGFYSGQGAVASAYLGPEVDDDQAQVRARLAGTVNAAGDIAVRAKSMDAHVTADGFGVSVSGAIGVGNTETKAQLAQTLRSSIGNGSSITGGGDVRVEALNLADWSTSTARASGGGGIAGETDTISTATSIGTAAAVVGDVTVHADGQFSVDAQTINLAKSSSEGNSGGFVGIGGVESVAKAGSGSIDNITTDAAILDNATLTVGSLKVNALSRDYASSTVNGTSGGFVGEVSASADTKVQPGVSASIGDGVVATITGEVVIRAESRAEGDSLANGFAAAAKAAGDSEAQTSITPVVRSTIGINAHISADGDLTITAVSGETSLAAGDGISTAETVGAAAGTFLGTTGGNASLGFDADVQAIVGERTSGGPTVEAAEIQIGTTSDVSVSTYSKNAGVGAGLAGKGLSNAIADIDNISRSTIGNGVILLADGNLTVSSTAVHFGDAQADAIAVGGAAFVSANSNVDIDYDVTTHVGSHAELSAGELLALTTTVSSSGTTVTNADAGGAGVSTSANTRMLDGGTFPNNEHLQAGGSQRGVRIGRDSAISRVEVLDDTDLSAKVVHLHAIVSESSGAATTDAFGGGEFGDTNGLSRVELLDHADVHVHEGVAITGIESVELMANIQSLTVDTFVKSEFIGGGPAYAYALGEVQTDSTVTADDAATITTHNLAVQALLESADVSHYAEKTGSNVDDGTNEYGDWNPEREILFDADVVLTSGRAVLIVQPDGSTFADGVTFSQTATAVVVDPIVNDHPGTALFRTSENLPAVTLNENVNDDGDKTTQQATGGSVKSKATLDALDPLTITFRQTLDEVLIENHSGKALIVDDIIVVNTTETPTITIDTAWINPTINGTEFQTFGFDLVQSFEPTTVTIQQLNLSSHDIVLGGVIDNPIGTTEVVNTGGSILTGLTGTIRTNLLFADADNNVGSSSMPLRIEYVASTQRPTGGNIHADSDVWLDVRGLNRDVPSANYTFGMGDISGVSVDLFVRPALDQTTLGPAPSFEADIFEQQQGDHYLRKSHYKPEGAALPSAPLSIFGIGLTEVESTNFFPGIVASGNISIRTADTATDINLQVVTDLTGTGKVDVAGNGDVIVIEEHGDLRVGLIYSTSGSVFLASVDGSIVDYDTDGGLDVAGTSITLMALQGSIGSKDNPLEINSSLPTSGLVSATAMGDIVLTEMEGDLLVGRIISSSADVCLTATRGDILDGNNDAAVDIQGVNITLLAPLGSIGEPTDDLDLDSSNPAPGTVTAVAFGGAGNIWISELGKISIESIQSIGTLSITSTGDMEVDDHGLVVSSKEMWLKIGGSLFLPQNAMIKSGGVVTIYGDWKDGHASGGTTMDLAGTVIGSSILIFGDKDADVFSLSGQFAGGPVTVKSGKGADVFVVDPRTAVAAETAGRYTMTLDGELDSDQYRIQLGRLGMSVRIADSGGKGTDRAFVFGTDGSDSLLIRNAVANGVSPQTGGSVMSNLLGQAVTYSQNLEVLSVDGRGGNDTFEVQPSQTTSLTIDGGTASPGGADRLIFDSWGLPVTKSGSTLLTNGGRPKNYLPVSVRNIDLTPPRATVNPLPAVTTTRTVRLNVSLSDPAVVPGEPVAGVASYDVYVSADSGAWTLLAGRVPATQSFVDFTGSPGHSYAFRAVATDFAGNREVEPGTPVAEAVTRIEAGDVTPPESRVTYVAVEGRTAQLIVSMTGQDAGGSGLRELRLWMSVDGEAPREVAGSPVAVTDIGPEDSFFTSVSVPGIRDGREHTYRFFTVAVDHNGNVEAAPEAPGDFEVRATFLADGTRMPASSTPVPSSRQTDTDSLFGNRDLLNGLLDGGLV